MPMKIMMAGSISERAAVIFVLTVVFVRLGGQ
jgi:hypothetical protein